MAKLRKAVYLLRAFITFVVHNIMKLMRTLSTNQFSNACEMSEFMQCIQIHGPIIEVAFKGS